MSRKENYFINNPVFVRYKRKFDFTKWRTVNWLKSVNINEWIVEIPFALECRSSLGQKGTVLDVGCFESFLPLYMAGLGYKVTAVDLRAYPYIFPNLQFCQANILHLPFANQSFDAVVCLSTLEHIGLDFYEGSKEVASGDQVAIREIFRVIKPQGMIVLTVPFGRYAVNRQQRTYDDLNLQRLLCGFQIEDQQFFKNFKSEDSRNNFWKKITKAEALQADTASPSMVCFLKAKKCA